MYDDRNGKPEDVDPPKSESPFARALRLGAAKASSPLDQKIMALKEIWDWMPPQERTNLKEWIEKLAPLERKPPSSLMGLMGSAEISLRYRRGGDYDLAVDGMKPFMIAQAIAAWERGEAFTPGIGEIFFH